MIFPIKGFVGRCCIIAAPIKTEDRWNNFTTDIGASSGSFATPPQAFKEFSDANVVIACKSIGSDGVMVFISDEAQLIENLEALNGKAFTSYSCGVDNMK